MPLPHMYYCGITVWNSGSATLSARPPEPAVRRRLLSQRRTNVSGVPLLLRNAKVDAFKRAGELEFAHAEFAALGRQECFELLAMCGVAEAVGELESHGLSEARQPMYDCRVVI